MHVRITHSLSDYGYLSFPRDGQGPGPMPEIRNATTGAFIQSSDPVLSASDVTYEVETGLHVPAPGEPLPSYLAHVTRLWRQEYYGRFD